MSLRRSFVALALFALAPATAPLAAYVGVNTFRGTHCNPSHFNGETEEWAHLGGDLVNQGTSNWDVMIASCPINDRPFTQAASSRIAEIRVVVDGGTTSNAWCRVTDAHGVTRQMNTSNGWWHWWTPPTNSGIHPRDYTIECLLLGGWSLERIEVVWFW